MYKTIPQLIGEITSLAVLITINTKADVFAEYSGHVKWFEIKIHSNGYESNDDADVYERIFCNLEYYEEKFILEKLNKVKTNLIRIARNGKVNFSILPYEIETIEVKKYKLF